MPDTPKSSRGNDGDDELNALLAAYLDGELVDPELRQRLADLIACSSGGLDLYTNLICLDVLLTRYHNAAQPPKESDLKQVGMEIGAGGDLSDATIMDAIREPIADVAAVAAQVQTPPPSPDVELAAPRRLTARRFWTPRRLAAAAAVLIVISCVAAWFRFGTAGPDVATVASATDAVWEDKPSAIGASLAAGKHVRLRSGTVEISFASGARVWVEGPADLELTGVNAAALHAGRILARVPVQAKGFSVQSSDLRVTDLGTEFGLSVSPGKSADVHVFEGAVNVTLPAGGSGNGSAPGSPIHLSSGMAVRCPVSSAGRAQPIPVDPQSFGRILPPAFASPGYDVGPVSKPGSDSYSKADGVFTVSGCGKDIWEASDAFRFVSIEHTGDVSVVVRVISQTNTDEWAKSGVMIRSSTTPGAAFAEMVLSPGHGASFQRRLRDGENMSYTTPSAPANSPVWLKLVRKGDLCSGFFSVDGMTWTQVGVEEKIAMPAKALVGLVVTSKNTAAASTAKFDHVVIGR